MARNKLSKKLNKLLKKPKSKSSPNPTPLPEVKGELVKKIDKIKKDLQKGNGWSMRHSSQDDTDDRS